MAAAKQSPVGGWRAVHPAEGAGWLSALTVPWWIAGGWALDLFVGNQSRSHGDLDIGVLRSDVSEVLATLSEWEIFEAKDGVLTQLDGGVVPRPAINSLWCRLQGTTSWTLELMLDASVDDCWVFRRRPEIRRPLTAAVRWSSDSLPYLAPEIQLLYKAKNPRQLDQADFDLVAPRLDPDAREWLRDAMLRWQPGHPWIATLGG